MCVYTYTVFTEINAHPEISAHQKQWFFKGGSTQNRWALMGDFSKGGVHKTDSFWWVIFQRGEYTKPMGFDGWFFKGGSTQNRWVLMGDFSKGGVHKTDGFWWVIFQRGEYTKPIAFGGFWNVFLLLPKIKRPGRLFWQIRCTEVIETENELQSNFLFSLQLFFQKIFLSWSWIMQTVWRRSTSLQNWHVFRFQHHTIWWSGKWNPTNCYGLPSP